MAQLPYGEINTAELFRNIVALANGYGVDVKKFILGLNTAELRHLEDFRERLAFDELVMLGCVPEVLSTCMFLVSVSRPLAINWKDTLGNSDAVRGAIELFEKAASEIERLYSMVSPNLSEPIAWPRIPLASPPEIIKTLRVYGALLEYMLRITPTIREEYIIDFPRYLVTGYVHMKTEDYRDRPVAALLSVALSTPAPSTEERFTDAASQKMWRFRRWTGLHQQFKSYLALTTELEAFLSR